MYPLSVVDDGTTRFTTSQRNSVRSVALVSRLQGGDGSTPRLSQMDVGSTTPSFRFTPVRVNSAPPTVSLTLTVTASTAGAR